MPYRAPNTYVRFIKTASPVNSVGSQRIMALIGTGLNYYEIYNESILKSYNKPYDVLKNPNVFEIMSVSSKPVIIGKNTPNNYIYRQGIDFVLQNGQDIIWNMLAGQDPTVTMTATATAGSLSFKDEITCIVDGANPYLVQDGEFLIEISYIDEIAGIGSGSYRVINNLTQEIIGEYNVSADPITNVIPGCLLTVVNTFDSGVTEIGDYVLVKTKAGKTETEATVEFNSTVSDPLTLTFSQDLQDAIQSLMIVSDANVVTDDFEVTVVTPSSGEFKIVRVSDNTKLYQGLANANFEYLEIIPGITFLLPALPATALAGDTVRISTVARMLGSVPGEGDVYYVSYKYKKADVDYDAKLFFNYDEVIDEYGNYDISYSSNVINSLTLGAEIAFQNGVSPVICVQAKNESDYEMKKAIDKLQRTLPGVNNVSTVIALTSYPATQAYIAEHVNLMSSYEMQKERITYIAASPEQLITKTPTALDKTIGMVETAKSFNDERVVYIVPGQITRSVKDLRTGSITERKLPSIYAAIAVACLGLKNDPAEPLTNKTISGFNSLTNSFMESEKNFLAGAGCLVLEQNGSNIRVRHGITTSVSEINSSEVTLVQIKDYIAAACRTATGDTYKGRKNTPSIISDITYTISNVLNQAISNNIILGFNGLSVKRNTENPTQVDVRFEISAVYPLNYIEINFSFAAVS